MTRTEYIIDDDFLDDETKMSAESQGYLWKLIRCKDCKYSSPNRVYGCRIHSFADDLDKRLYADDYCSYAERKEE